MKILVQKFGGTSLAGYQEREAACTQIIRAREAGYKPIVVVSAMGRKGQAYATDTLLNIPESKKDIPARQRDLLASCGEVISAVVISGKLNERDYPAEPLTGGQAGIITDENFGASRIIAVNPDKLTDLLEKDIIPVVAGYQGQSKTGEITTLGRGGSDTTASAIAFALEAERIDLFSDVSGLMTADPDVYEGAEKLNRVTYNEACELAYQGAKVIHPRAAEFAQAGKIPLKICSTKITTEVSSGTIITDSTNLSKDRPVTGVATRTHISFVEISPDSQKGYDSGLKSFCLLADKGISVDMINIRPDKISFIVDEDKVQQTRTILTEAGFIYKLNDRFCKLSIVGSGMTGLPGVMARIVDALHDVGIKIYQTTDSHTTISCLIKKAKESEAVKAVHEAFALSEII
ncbi:MAG: aspartate kinase [Bacillota bacterium]